MCDGEGCEGQGCDGGEQGQDDGGAEAAGGGCAACCEADPFGQEAEVAVADLRGDDGQGAAIRPASQSRTLA